MLVFLALQIEPQTKTHVAEAKHQAIGHVQSTPKKTIPTKRATKPKTSKPPKQPTIVAPAGKPVNWLRGAGIAPSDWQYVSAIFGQESGWRLDTINYLGCIGLGQACPSGNKAEMLQRCPDWKTNGVCQMKVWKDYMLRRYGTWSYAVEWKFCTKICYNAHLGVTVNKHGEPWW